MFSMIKLKIELWKMRILKFRLLILPYAKLNKEQEENRRYWMYYIYLKNKYRKFLEKLPTYKGSGEYSNKVWWCWLQGEENAPELSKACLKSLRKELIDREIIVITRDNFNQYVCLPDYILEKYNQGLISHTHFSDLLRLELLIKNGGTWIDSSVYCTGYDKSFFDRPLFVFQNWKRGNDSMALSSWFITAEKNNPILTTTRDLLYSYWKKNNYMLNYFLLHLFFTITIEKYPKLWKDIPRFSNLPPHILQFEIDQEYSKKRFDEIKKMSCFHKLTQKRDFSDVHKNSIYYKIINN